MLGVVLVIVEVRANYFDDGCSAAFLPGNDSPVTCEDCGEVVHVIVHDGQIDGADCRNKFYNVIERSDGLYDLEEAEWEEEGPTTNSQ